MTHIRIEASHTDDERWIGAGGDAFAVHVAALVYCDRQLNDGRISRAMALRVSLAVDPADATEAVRALLERGFWTEIDGGYQIEDYLEHAFPAEQIKRTRARWKTDKDRRRQHEIGDHSLCKDPKFCPAIRDGSTVEADVDSATDAHAYTKPNSNKPNPTVGKGLGGESRSADAPDLATDESNDPPASPTEVAEVQQLKAQWAAQRESKQKRRLTPVLDEEDAS